jgi:hypothetical protein
VKSTNLQKTQNKRQEVILHNNKCHSMSFTSAITLETGNEHSHKFALVTIQANKGIRLSLYLPSRAIESTWGGLVIGMNIAINGVWYNLGNYGNSGNVAIRNRTSSGSFFSEKILDFIAHDNVPRNESYTIQVELKLKAEDGKIEINTPAMDINGTRVTSVPILSWASIQNFPTVNIEEFDAAPA